MNFGLLFQKWSLGTQESFCKVSDQLDTWLNNYGLISRHNSSINCVNNCTFIFKRHQPRLFLKALQVITMTLTLMLAINTKILNLSEYYRNIGSIGVGILGFGILGCRNSGLWKRISMVGILGCRNIGCNPFELCRHTWHYKTEKLSPSDNILFDLNHTLKSKICK